MTLPSKTTLEGKPAKANTTITIHWNKDMVFNGKFAEFHGGVQAVQDQARLQCQTLQVTLDRAVSFKDGQKDRQNAQLEKLVCDRRVFLVEEIVENGRKASIKRLEGVALAMDNQDGPINVSGPGKVIHVALGPPELALPQPGPKPPVPGPFKQVMKLTRIDFEGRMYATNKANSRHAKFFDGVEVYHQPGDDPDVHVNPNQPPKDGFYLRCGLLEVATHEINKSASSVMVASSNVFFRTREFFGNADVVKYDQGLDQIIFEGRPTTLFKLGAPGDRPGRISGSKILYNRKNGTFQIDGGQMISSW
jgi:hypothetical protein